MSSFLDKVATVRTALGLELSMAAPAVIEAANSMMGIEGQGALPEQLDALVT